MPGTAQAPPNRPRATGSRCSCRWRTDREQRSATAESRPVPTAHEYIAWLEESGTPGADQTAAEFKALSRQDQKKFLSYLTDPASLQALAEAAAGVGPQTVTLGNGDVVIETEGASGRSLGTLGTAGDWRCWYRVKQSVLGVTITRLNLDQWYHSTSTKVDRVYSAKATKTNYNIGVSISHGIERQWISAAGNALALRRLGRFHHLQGLRRQHRQAAALPLRRDRFPLRVSEERVGAEPDQRRSRWLCP